jgi:hypothetical protein
MFFRTLALATSSTAMRQFSLRISLSRYSGEPRWDSENGSSCGGGGVGGVGATGTCWGAERLARSAIEDYP